MWFAKKLYTVKHFLAAEGRLWHRHVGITIFVKCTFVFTGISLQFGRVDGDDEGTERIIFVFGQLVRFERVRILRLLLLLLYPGVETLLPVMDSERLLVEFLRAVQDLDCEVLNGRVDVRVAAGKPQRLGGLPVTADADGRR